MIPVKLQGKQEAVHECLAFAHSTCRLYWSQPEITLLKGVATYMKQEAWKQAFTLIKEIVPMTMINDK